MTCFFPPRVITADLLHFDSWLSAVCTDKPIPFVTIVHGMAFRERGYTQTL